MKCGKRSARDDVSWSTTGEKPGWLLGTVIGDLATTAPTRFTAPSTADNRPVNSPPVLVERLRLTAHQQTLHTSRDLLPVPYGTDPVDVAANADGSVWTHSTSWRTEQNTVVLTFITVYPDGYPVAQWQQVEEFTAAQVQTRPVLCHALRHLGFLHHAEPQVGALVHVTDLLDFTHEVIEQHYPAVAGLFTH